MHHKASPYQLFWHVVGAGKSICEVILLIKSQDYSGAVPHAFKAAGHISVLAMQSKTLRKAGDSLCRATKRIIKRLLS